MKNLKKFETDTQYNAYTADTANFVKPNTSLISETNEVAYNSDPYNGHDYVEIGGLKWATMNIGANSVTDYGKYFQWADINGYTASEIGSGSGKKWFHWTTYKFNGTSTWPGVNKYQFPDGQTEGIWYDANGNFIGDGYRVIRLCDDAARANWGGQWRMPTKTEFIALRNAVNSAWTASYQGSGISGMVLTDKTDSSKELFFPVAGYAFEGAVTGTGRDGDYWSSSLTNQYSDDAARLGFYKTAVEWEGGSTARCFGLPIRGVVGQRIYKIDS